MTYGQNASSWDALIRLFIPFLSQKGKTSKLICFLYKHIQGVHMELFADGEKFLRRAGGSNPGPTAGR